MKSTRQVLTPNELKEEVEYRTDRNKQYSEVALKKLKRFKKDPDWEKRLSVQECKYCYYINNNRIGCAALTESNCRICDKSIMFSSTVLDDCCESCAKEHGVCKHCLSKMEVVEK